MSPEHPLAILTQRRRFPITTIEKIVEKAEQARQALGDAMKAKAERDLELSNAEAEVARIEQAWKVGDASIPASALLAGQAEVTRASGLAVAAAREVKVQQGRQMNLDPTYADAVAHALGRTWRGIPILPTVVEPETPAVADLPVAYAVHTQTSTERHSTFNVRTVYEVDLVVYGPSYLPAPSADDVRDELRKAGVLPDPGDRSRFTTTQHGEVIEHRLSLELLRLQPEFPHWADPKQTLPGTLLSEYADTLIRFVRESTRPGKYGPNPDAVVPVDGEFLAGRVVGSRKAGKGFTDTTIQLDLELRTSTYGRTAAASAEIRNDVVKVAERQAQAWARVTVNASHVRSVKITAQGTGSGSQVPARAEVVVRSRDKALTLADVA